MSFKTQYKNSCGISVEWMDIFMHCHQQATHTSISSLLSIPFRVLSMSDHTNFNVTSSIDIKSKYFFMGIAFLLILFPLCYFFPILKGHFRCLAFIPTPEASMHSKATDFCHTKGPMISPKSLWSLKLKKCLISKIHWFF